MRWPVLIFGGMAALVVVKSMTQPKLKHFKASEFGGWWPLMNRDLLLKLDEFRERWGVPVQISPASGAIGRETKGSASQHNVLRWGEVRAVDVMPVGMTTEAAKRRAVEIARDVGFTGIGLYPDWQPWPGLHLDVRADREPGDPAEWAGVKTVRGQEYVALDRGYV